MKRNRLLLLLALLMTAATGAWADESETINTASGKTVYTGTHFKITASLGCDDDGIILWNGDESTSGTATIEALNGENITKIEMHMTYGGQVANYTTTTAGKLVATNSSGNANDISVTDINATSVTIGTSYNGVTWININKFVIYYGPAPAAGYTVSVKDGVKDADKWTITPNPAEEGQTVTLQYTGRLKVKGVKATSDAAPADDGIDLSKLTENTELKDGDVLTGTLASNVKISIADGATVTLKDVNINASGSWTSGNYAGITCAGDATITLEGTNTVKGFADGYPGIFVSSGKTIVINGTGELNASSNGSFGAGIGGGDNMNCGNIEIQSGTVTATGNGYGAGIGGGNNANCGNITISGGTVTATGGDRAAGIGGGRRGTSGTKGGYDSGSCGNITISGGTITATGGDDAAGIGGGRGNNNNYKSSCGTITITTGVTKVTATMGDGATNSIGAGSVGTCGTVTIGGNVGAITTSPYTYQPSN